MVSVPAWKHVGDVKYSAAVVRKAANVSQSSSQASTQQRNFSFPKENRLRLNNELEDARDNGKNLRTRNLEVRVLQTQQNLLRVGIVVPKYSHTIVKRNQLRRRIRELVRTRLLPNVASGDIFIRPLPRAYGVSFAELGEDVDIIVKKLV